MNLVLSSQATEVNGKRSWSYPEVIGKGASRLVVRQNQANKPRSAQFHHTS